MQALLQRVCQLSEQLERLEQRSGGGSNGLEPRRSTFTPSSDAEAIVGPNSRRSMVWEQANRELEEHEQPKPAALGSGKLALGRNSGIGACKWSSAARRASHLNRMSRSSTVAPDDETGGDNGCSSTSGGGGAPLRTDDDGSGGGGGGDDDDDASAAARAWRNSIQRERSRVARGTAWASGIAARISGRFQAGPAGDGDDDGHDAKEDAMDYFSLTNASLWHLHIPKGMIHPFGRWRRAWEAALAALVLYSTLNAPLTIAFDIDDPPAHVAADFGVTLFFLCDILTNFATGYADQGKVVVMERSKVVRRYVRGWLWLDLLAALPPLVAQLLLAAGGAAGLKVVRLLEMVRLSHGPRVRVFDALWSSAGFRLLYLLLFYLVVLHCIACAYWALATLRRDSRYDAGGALCGGAGGAAFVWGVCDETRDADLSERYSYALNWALNTLIGNPPAAHGILEQLTSALITCIGLLVEAAIIGETASLLLNLDQNTAERREQMSRINDHLRYHRIPPKLGHKVRRYYDYYYACGRNRDDDQLFAALPTQLRLQLALCQKKPLILKVRMFNNLPAPCTVAIVSALTPRIALDGEYVLVQGRPADAMFFIRRGVVQVSRFVHFVEKAIVQLSDGAHFGEMGLIEDHGTCTANVVAIVACDLQQLSRVSFSALLAQFKEFREAVARVSHERRASLLTASANKTDKPLRSPSPSKANAAPAAQGADAAKSARGANSPSSRTRAASLWRQCSSKAALARTPTPGGAAAQGEWTSEAPRSARGGRLDRLGSIAKRRSSLGTKANAEKCRMEDMLEAQSRPSAVLRARDLAEQSSSRSTS